MAHPRLPMADCHNDLLMPVVHLQERGHEDPFGDFWLPQLREGGVVLQVLPVYTEDQFIGEGALRRAMRLIEAAWHTAERHADDVAVVTTAGELRSTIDAGRIALVLAFEGMEPIGADLDLIDSFYRLGVRIGGLTWNRRTLMADGLGEAGTGAGLTTFGRAAVARMERVGMVVDVSHLADAGFRDVAAVSERPFIASHSSCRDVHGHPRNLTDEMLTTIAESGGFACMNAIGAFCAEGAVIDDFVRHIAHAVDVVGAEHVGLGMDFVVDLVRMMDPILGDAYIDIDDFELIEGLQRPADLAALGPRLETALGAEAARRVSAGSMIEGLGRLLPA
jgi:membrane dipeptidase